MIKFNVNIINTTYNYTHKEEEAFVKRILTVRVPGYNFSNAFREGKWDGFLRFYNLNYFPSGLLRSVVIPMLEQHGVHYRVENVCPELRPGKKLPKLSGVEIRDYQEEIVRACEKEQRGIIYSATNSGKTEVAILLYAYFNVPTIMLVNDLQLQRQTIERFRDRLGVECGQIGNSVHKLDSNVVVAMVQSLKNYGSAKMKYFSQRFKMLLIDECHQSSADTYVEVSNKFKQAFLRFGFSGTPLQDNVIKDMRMLSITGPVIGGVSNKEMIDRGLSTVPEIHVYKYDEGYEWPESGNTLLNGRVVRNVRRNRYVADLAQHYASQGKNVLVAVDRTTHGDLIAANLSSPIISYGEHNLDTRFNNLRRFEENAGSIMISTVMNQSVDIPCIDVLVMPHPTKSLVRVLQRIGRALRKGNKDKCIIVDIVDACSEHYLAYALQRFRYYEEEGFTYRWAQTQHPRLLT